MAIPDFEKVTSLAYGYLIRHRFNFLPIKTDLLVESCREDGLLLESFQKYARLTGQTLEDLTCGGKYNDGLYVEGLRPGLRFILYNVHTNSKARLRHTILHEIGHVECGHKDHGDIEEVEAHFFAAQFCMPNVLIAQMLERGYEINMESLMKTFGVSGNSAEIKLNYLEEHSEIHAHPLDHKVVELFQPYLDRYFPYQVRIEANRNQNL